MNYPYNQHIMFYNFVQITCQTCFSGERLKAPCDATTNNN